MMNKLRVFLLGSEGRALVGIMLVLTALFLRYPGASKFWVSFASFMTFLLCVTFVYFGPIFLRRSVGRTWKELVISYLSWPVMALLLFLTYYLYDTTSLTGLSEQYATDCRASLLVARGLIVHAFVAALILPPPAPTTRKVEDNVTEATEA